MSSSRFQYAYRENASKLHKAVGEILRTADAFGEYEAYQEYPVNRVNPLYPESSHHFDWVIPDLKVVIECHGVQHYKVVDWEGGEAEKAIVAYKALKERDFAKREAAWAVDWIYVEVPYSVEKKLNETVLLDMITEARNAFTEYETTHTEEVARKREEQRRQEVALRSERAKKIKADQKAQYQKMRGEYLESDKHKEVLKKASEARRTRYHQLLSRRR